VWNSLPPYFRRNRTLTIQAVTKNIRPTVRELTDHDALRLFTSLQLDYYK